MKKFLVLCAIMFSVVVFAQKVTNKMVESGCGMCQYQVKSNKDCSMSVKIDGKVYPVKGFKDEHYGDAHAKEGYCNLKRPAKVSGTIKNGKFYATKFDFVAPKKN